MSQLARTILRAKLQPYEIGKAFTLQDGKTFRLYKGGGVDLWLALYEDASTPFDVSNVGLLQLLCRIKGGTGAWSVLGSTTSMNPAMTAAQWTAGTAAHAVITLLGSATSIAAGNYDVTIKGWTSDDPADVDVFGKSDLEVLDVGATETTTALPEGQTPATIEELAALMTGYARVIGLPGQEDVKVSPNEHWRWVRGIDNNGETYERIEEVS
ncbi:MAG: hypothetical protein V2A79_08065 [Planctomycetota bacterium]